MRPNTQVAPIPAPHTGLTNREKSHKESPLFLVWANGVITTVVMVWVYLLDLVFDGRGDRAPGKKYL